MTKVAVVYYSGYGHTAKLAEAVVAGAASVGGATATAYAIDADGNLPDGAFDALAGVDAIIFGSPTYMGGVAWQFKKFADASSKVWAGQGWKDKIAGGFTNSASPNGDKGQTMNSLFTLALQHGMIWVGTGLMPASKKENTPNDTNYSGGFTGVMAISPADAGPDEAPRKGDLEAARLLGARVAEKAAKLHA